MSCCSAIRHRPDRQDGPHRLRSVRSSGCFRQSGRRPAISLNQDDFVVLPYTTFQRMFGLRVVQIIPRGGWRRRCRFRSCRAGDSPGRRHRRNRAHHAQPPRARLDEPNDFDIVTQDALMRVWNQISQATFFALVVISSIALMVGGIGVMAIMSISVTERTREIGVRRALGARRREVLFQFLTEAAVLTSVGGMLGILLGAASGWPCISSPDSRSRFLCGPSRWALASPPLSVSSSACIRPSAPRASIRSKRCGMSSLRKQQNQILDFRCRQRLARRAGRITSNTAGVGVCSR